MSFDLDFLFAKKMKRRKNMEEKMIKLSQEEMDGIIQLRDSIRENTTESGKLNIQKHFIQTELDMIDSKLQEVYTKAEQLEALEKELIDSVGEKVADICGGFTPEIEGGGDLSDWYSFTTNEDDITDSEIAIKGNKLIVSVSNEYYVYQDSDN